MALCLAGRVDFRRGLLDWASKAMPDKAEYFRSLHQAPPVLILPNAWDAATARVFEAAGFRAVATTSAGVAAALGYPDGGVVPPREMIEAIARIARAVEVPVTADIEHAYAATPTAVAEGVLRGIAGPVNVLAVAGTPPVSELEQLGVARVSVGSGPMRASIALVHEVAQELKTRGTYTSYTARALPYTDLNDLMRR